MKISLNWLNDFVDVSDYFSKAHELGEKLTAAGLEVEAVESKGNFEHLKIGKILELKKHPDADKLTVCQIDVGDGQIRQIVCGATNHKQGDLVCVALPGCVLPGDFKIKQSKIRGQESSGMLCSDKEMGLSEEAQGIRILDAKAPIGEDVTTYLGIRDAILEISVTPNRADCLSHWGLARELSCLLGRPLKSLKPKIAEVKKPSRIKLIVKNSTSCPRFTGRILSGVKVKPSPAWLKQRLESCGMNSVNNVVDITNYVMLELGQPMHAYDTSFITGDVIEVENSHKGEVFTSFDGSEYILTGEELCIRNSTSVIGLAGVVGSKNSGINDNTKEIYLECAYFMPSSVRKTSRRFGIETDAGYRFSRGTDIEILKLASDRACELLCQLADAKIESEMTDFYENPAKPAEIAITVDDVTKRLGFTATEEKLEQWLTRLHCKFTKKDKTFLVTAPSFRYDFVCKEDIIEEYGRLEGYDQIPEILPQMSVFPTSQDPSYIRLKVLSDEMTTLGFNQAYNYNFFSSQTEKEYVGDISKLSTFGIGHKGESVKLKNPLNELLDVMRSSLAPQLFNNALHNWKYGRAKGQLFEVGSVFYKNEDQNYKEENRLAAIYWGEESEYWQTTNQPQAWPVFQLKATLQSLLQKLGISSYKIQNIEESPSDFFHPKQLAQIVVEGKVVGMIGSVHPKILEEQKFRTPVAYFELNVDPLFRGYPRFSKVKPLVYFPIVKRDMTFELPETTKFEDLHNVLTKSIGKKLIKVELKDIYKGERLAKGEHALTVSLSLQDESKLLEDAALDQIQNAVFKAVENRFKN